MTVRELIYELLDQDLNAVVILAEDAEGNGFHHVDEVVSEEANGEVLIWPGHARVEED